MTFFNVLVQLVNKRVQMLPLLGRKLKCIAGMNPLAQRAAFGWQNIKTVKCQTHVSPSVELVKGDSYLVPMPCPLVPTKANRERKPSGTNHCNTVTPLIIHAGSWQISNQNIFFLFDYTNQRKRKKTETSDFHFKPKVTNTNSYNEKKKKHLTSCDQRTESQKKSERPLE